MFDWANQPFYTLIMTFVFSVYFTDVFITGDDGAQKLTLTQTISGLAIALLSPVLGSITDIKGCLLYTSPSPRDLYRSRMPSSA